MYKVSLSLEGRIEHAQRRKEKPRPQCWDGVVFNRARNISDEEFNKNNSPGTMYSLYPRTIAFGTRS